MLAPGEGRLAGFFRQRGFSVWVKRVQTPRRLAPGLHTLQSALLARQLNNLGIGLVLCNTFPAASRVARAARLAGLPLAIYVREYIRDTPLHRAILQRADLVLAVSADLQRHLQAMLPLHPQSPSLISAATTTPQVCLAYDTIDPDPLRERLAAHRAAVRDGRPPILSSITGANPTSPATASPVVGWVGRLAPFKQPELFLQAIPAVLERVPAARFVVVGAAQPSEKAFEEALVALAERLGIRAHVAFLGSRTDNIEIISELSLLCVTSSREPLGRVILEAALAGVPAVAPRTGGPAEIITHGQDGLLFDPTGPKPSDAPARLASQICLALEDEALRRSLASRAREGIAARFAGPQHVLRIAELLAGVGGKV
jgi:glycosyltransferase involved in cell wall biosynthesis